MEIWIYDAFVDLSIAYGYFRKKKKKQTKKNGYDEEVMRNPVWQLSNGASSHLNYPDWLNFEIFFTKQSRKIFTCDA